MAEEPSPSTAPAERPECVRCGAPIPEGESPLRHDYVHHRPANVVQAIARIMEELPGIGKDSKAAPEQGAYSYRGIEAITAGIQRLLGRYGVVFTPEVLEEATEHLTINNKPWTDTRLKVLYHVRGPAWTPSDIAADEILVGPFVAIGRDNSDKGANKCQPVGTLVRVPTGARRGGHVDAHADYVDVPIETLRTGDKVVTWSRRRSGLVASGRPATVASRPYDGRLVTVRTVDGRTSSYTPDHHCLVRFPTELSAGSEVVYLMRRDGQYRVGRCRWRGSAGDSGKRRVGLAWRCWAESADAAWVLSVHPSVEEAALHEALTAVRFGLPTKSFTGRSDPLRGRRVSAFPLADFWAKVGDNRPQAVACLAAHGRLIDWPLFERTPGSQVGTLPTTVTAAANLLSGMLVGVPLHPVSNNRGWLSWPVAWTPIIVGANYYSGLVYSLDVATEHTYVADGIVTHNCMTQAFKYALLQTFAIGDPKDDADSGSPATDARDAGAPRRAPAKAPDQPAPVPTWQELGFESFEAMREVNDPLKVLWEAHIRPLPREQPIKAGLVAWLKERGYHVPIPVSLADADEFRGELEVAVAQLQTAQSPQAPAEGSGEPPVGAGASEGPSEPPADAEAPPAGRGGRRPRTPREPS